MLQQFLNQLKESKLIKNEAPVLLGVSGGVDSMVMAHLFLQSGISVAVAHVNFMLRGSESDGDEDFVKQWCHRNEIPFYSKAVETSAYALENGISIQMAARDFRYEYFNELRIQHSFGCIATGHNLDDSTETIAFNLLRGTGMAGLLGIPAKSGSVIRPLLFATRAEIQAYAIENKLPWREDSSNQLDDYHRNFIRHQLTPLFEKINPSYREAFQRMGRNLADAEGFLIAQSQHYQQAWKLQADGTWLIDRAQYFKAGGQTLLGYSLREFGFSWDQVEQVVGLNRTGSKVIGSSHTLFFDRDSWVLGENVAEFPEVEITAPGHYSAGIWHLTVEEVPINDTMPGKDPLEAFMDAQQATFPFRWRGILPGDSFQPLGLTHSKKVSDFLVDAKVSGASKVHQTVLEDQHGIQWLVGRRIADRVKLTSATTRVLVFRLFPKKSSVK